MALDQFDAQPLIRHQSTDTSSPWNEREEKPRNEAQRRYNDDGDQVVQMTNYPNVFRGLVWSCHDIRPTRPQPKKRRQQSHGCAVPRVDMPYEASQLLPVPISYYSSFPPGTRKDSGRPLATLAAGRRPQSRRRHMAVIILRTPKGTR